MLVPLPPSSGPSGSDNTTFAGPACAATARAPSGAPEKTWLGAWHAVDNALTAYGSEQARRDEWLQAEADNRRALGLAQSRYQQGVADFLAVLDAERNLLATQQQLADSTTTISSNLVALYKALGGGWEPDFPDDEKTARR